MVLRHRAIQHLIQRRQHGVIVKVELRHDVGIKVLLSDCLRGYLVARYR